MYVWGVGELLESSRLDNWVRSAFFPKLPEQAATMVFMATAVWRVPETNENIFFSGLNCRLRLGRAGDKGMKARKE